jgi:5-methylcytosine-specific restriction endonuclease McrA
MTEKQLREVWERTSGHCHFCGDPVEFEKRGWKGDDLTGYWEVDHILQKAKGGSNSFTNCLAACTRCNRLRWHRKGEAVRELLFLGLIARDEITRSTTTGKRLTQLREKRLVQNKVRRTKRKLTPLDPPSEESEIA